jgi:hypothetical protein
MSTRKPKPHEVIADVVQSNQMRTDYQAFLAAEKLEDCYASADRFAIRATAAGTQRAYGKTERQIIIALAGRIDPMYD